MNIIKRVDIGNTRDINQDYSGYVNIGPKEAFLVVCDGMGGHLSGEIASQMTAEYILEHCTLHSDFCSEDDIKAWMHELINNANDLVHEKSLTDEKYQGMGTTVVLAYINDSHLYIAHVGDSRAYVIGDEIEQITSDDTLVNALVKSGTISIQEAKYHPQKNILLQAVGVSSPLSISFYTQKLDHQYVFLCSDGLYNSLSQERILEIFNAYKDLDDIGDQLIDQSNLYGGFDNIGFVIAKEETDNESH